MADIDWSLLRPNPNFTSDYVNAFTTGQALGKAQVVRNAFANFSADPSGSFQRLISAGAIPEAGALSNLQYQQAQRALIGRLMERFSGGGAPPNAMTAQPGAAQPPAITAPAQSQSTAAPNPAENVNFDPTSLSEDQRGGVHSIASTLDSLALELGGLPYEQRKARLAQEAPALIQAGLPADMVNSFDPTDAELSRVHDATAETRRTVGPMASQTPAAPVAQPGSPGLDIRDPDTQGMLASAGLMGIDVGPLVSMATATMPKGSGGERPGSFERDQYGNVIGPKDARGRIYGVPNSDGSQPVYDPSTGSFTIEAAPGAVAAKHDLAGAESGGKAAGEMPYIEPRARAQAAGTGAGSAPYEMVTVNMPPDADHPGGYTVQMPKSAFLAQAGAGAPSGAPARGAVPPPGAVRPIIGQSAGPGAEKFAQDDAAAFSKTLETEADPQTIMGYQRSAQTATQAVNAAMAINPNAWTPAAKSIADTLNALTGGHVGEREANDLNYYASLIPQVTRTTFKTFPRLEKEFETVKAAIPGLRTPRDAAALTFASIAATNNQNAEFAQFASQYQGAPSERALNQAWQATPQARRSIFADPVFSHLTIDGKPAVFIQPKPAANGHVYGVFRPGTPAQQVFMVQ